MHFWGGDGGKSGGDGGGDGGCGGDGGIDGGDGGAGANRAAISSGVGLASQPVCDFSVEHSFHFDQSFAAHKVV
jgi:hypothetical protein